MQQHSKHCGFHRLRPAILERRLKVTQPKNNLQTSSSLFLRMLAAIVMATIGAGCSPEANKARLLEQAGRYFNSGEYDKAKIEYVNLLRADPQNATAIQQLGIIWFNQGAPLRAIPFLLKAHGNYRPTISRSEQN